MEDNLDVCIHNTGLTMTVSFLVSLDGFPRIKGLAGPLAKLMLDCLIPIPVLADIAVRPSQDWL